MQKFQSSHQCLAIATIKRIDRLLEEVVKRLPDLSSYLWGLVPWLTGALPF